MFVPPIHTSTPSIMARRHRASKSTSGSGLLKYNDIAWFVSLMGTDVILKELAAHLISLTKKPPHSIKIITDPGMVTYTTLGAAMFTGFTGVFRVNVPDGLCFLKTPFQDSGHWVAVVDGILIDPVGEKVQKPKSQNFCQLFSLVLLVHRVTGETIIKNFKDHDYVHNFIQVVKLLKCLLDKWNSKCKDGGFLALLNRELETSPGYFADLGLKLTSGGCVISSGSTQARDMTRSTLTKKGLKQFLNRMQHSAHKMIR